VNPYLHSEDEHLFQVRLLIIDIKGHSDEVIRTIRSINVGNRPPAALTFTTNWGFGTAPNLLPYVQVGAPGALDNTKTGTFTILPKGATGFYEYKLDINGDGFGDYDYVDGPDQDTNPDTAVLAPGADKWVPVTAAGTTVSVVFGPHPDPTSQNNPPPTVNQVPAPSYYAAQVIVRALDSAGGNQVDVMTRQTPVSLVQVGPNSSATIDVDASDPEIDELPALQDHQMVPFQHLGAGGGNGASLADRGVVIVGGAQGTTALRDVTRITQTFNQPINPGDIETLASTVVEELTPMTVARRGHTSFMFDDVDPSVVPTGANPVVYSVGGRNPDVGPLASVEFQPFDLAKTDDPWLLSGSEMNPTGGAFPLFDFGSAMNVGFFFQEGTPPGPVLHRIPQFVGGLNQPAKNANANVSGMTFQFGPFVEKDPTDDQWATQNGTLGVPRYDLATVVIGATLYAIGGRSASGQSVATLEKFDLNNDNGWVQLPNMRDARAGCTAEVIAQTDSNNNVLPAQIYVFGGAYFPGIAGNRTLVQTAEVFNPSTQTWSYTVPPAASSYAAASARLPGPGSVDIISGGELNTVWYYGGEIGQSSSQGETNKLEELIYFYDVP
jgi:hypothetical protein